MSDFEDSDRDSDADSLSDVPSDRASEPAVEGEAAFHIQPIPAPKRQAQEKRKQEYLDALVAMEKLLKSRKTEFEAGPDSLQARHACAIHGVLVVVVGRKKNSLLIASQMSAETNGFSPNHGSRLLHGWTRECIRRSHAKVFSMLKMLPTAAKDYAKHITGTEMPEGLKKYLELELFPCIGLKMTAQANDGLKWRWVFEGEHAIRKKGVGRGIHQSDVICSTYGWLKDASQTLEYGKNYEGYWNGELFIKQALFLIDNSQGHAAYAEDALLATRMNLNPGGKQARLRNGWFERDGNHFVQSMIFPHDHPEFPNQPKGMKVYLRDHCDYTFDTLKANMPKAMESVLQETIRRWEHCVHRWISAYRDVKTFSSKKYKSHRRIPESLAVQFDT
ncbi:hypothetical protein F5876DRAFT_91626 [Lentinula aff. lateritia]|uniref:Uncharacterized protein n=1 Tax=Lentinula aff. lateritia TaxID=2804960 RepID=A0ACC1TK48_9AGAR|nr:hypothetical protein F5876DRAFT_91626 [Lentinula aff. lateritia]